MARRVNAKSGEKAVGRDGGRGRGEEEVSGKVVGCEKKSYKYGERGELVGASGGHIVPATSLAAMTSQQIFLLVCYYRATTPPLQRGTVELLPAAVFEGRVWGAAFMSTITPERKRGYLLF